MIKSRLLLLFVLVIFTNQAALPANAINALRQLNGEATIELKRIPKLLPLSWREQHRSIS
jgi:hypothetical protein